MGVLLEKFGVESVHYLVAEETGSVLYKIE